MAAICSPEDLEAPSSPAWSTASSQGDNPAPLRAPLLKAYPKLGLEREEEPSGVGLLARLGLSARWALVLAMAAGVVIGAGAATAALKAQSQNAPTPKGPWRWPISPDAKWIPDLETVRARGERKMITVDGRSVWVYRPAEAAAGPLPAVVVLHGSDDTALGIAETTRFERVADMAEGGFLVVLPEMKEAGGDSWGFQHDEPFFRSLVEGVGGAYALDRQRVFVVGHSNGGTMALYLQNNMPDVFASGAAVEAGGGAYHLWSNTTVGRPTMVVWNQNDEVLAEFGGEKLYRGTVGELIRRAPASSVDAPPFEEPLPVGDGVVYATRKVWPAVGASPELQVISWASKQPTHSWLNPRLVPGAALDASVLLWEFFNSAAAPAEGAA